MPLLASFAYAGQFCLANGTSCLATGIVGDGGAGVDWCDWIPIATSGGAPSGPSIPVRLITRTGATILFHNGNPGANGEVFALYLHSIIR